MPHEPPLPPYAFVPGLHPHPRRDPRGHAYGQPEPKRERLDATDWAASATYLRAFTLLNAGYCWEAHELFEALWHASEGPVKSLLQGLIRLVAAGVKLREGRPRGVRHHGQAAAALFAEVRAQAGATVAGLDLAEAEALALRVASAPVPPPSEACSTVVFPERIWPHP